MSNVADDQVTRATGRAQSPRWNHHILPSHRAGQRKLTYWGHQHEEESLTHETWSLKVKSTQQRNRESYTHIEDRIHIKTEQNQRSYFLMQTQVDRGSALPNDKEMNITWWSWISYTDIIVHKHRNREKKHDSSSEWVSACGIWSLALIGCVFVRCSP